MTRDPRLKQGTKPGGEWRKKVHPYFVEMMEQYKQIEPLGRSRWKEDRDRAQQQWARSPHEELRKKAQEVGDEFRRSGKVLHDFAGKILDLDPSTVQEPSDEQFMLCWLSWFKYGKTWRRLNSERNAGNWEASQQILAILGDYEKWTFGRLDPNDMRFKMDRPHFTLMASGLDFGLETFTANELADCFDALCTCGVEQHDPENLRKLRARILRSLEELNSQTSLEPNDKIL
jgi:hypothetical protein